jgi:hypothetical protein
MLLEQCDRDAVMSKVENSRVHLVRGTIDDHLVSLRNASRGRIFAGSGQLQSARTLIPGVPDRQRQKPPRRFSRVSRARGGVFGAQDGRASIYFRALYQLIKA